MELSSKQEPSIWVCSKDLEHQWRIPPVGAGCAIDGCDGTLDYVSEIDIELRFKKERAATESEDAEEAWGSRIELAKTVLEAAKEYGHSYGIDSECGICGGDSRSTLPHFRKCPVPLAWKIVNQVG